MPQASSTATSSRDLYRELRQIQERLSDAMIVTSGIGDPSNLLGSGSCRSSAEP
jgi:hypothetical protein